MSRGLRQGLGFGAWQGLAGCRDWGYQYYSSVGFRIPTILEHIPQLRPLYEASALKTAAAKVRCSGCKGLRFWFFVWGFGGLGSQTSGSRLLDFGVWGLRFRV